MHNTVSFFLSILNILRLPDWANSALKSGTLDYLSDISNNRFIYTNEAKKLQSGFLLKEILSHFSNKTLSRLNPNRLLYIYSAHDVTVFNALKTLNLDYKVWNN